jgi:signal transduction histidine kinase
VAARVRAPILVKLLVALVIPAVALFTLFAFVAYEVSRRDLDAELGRRLEAIAASAATQLRGKYLAELQPGNEDGHTYQNAVTKLANVARATDVQLSVFDRNFDARADDAGALKIGSHYFRAELDRSELEQVFDTGVPAQSVTFEGNDGKIYKAGYAPVRACVDCGDDNDARVVLAIRAQAPASYFERLGDLRDRLFLWGGGLAAVSILAAAIATLLITRNVRRLVIAAERIGSGDLRAPVVIETADELGMLGHSMEQMRRQLAERDARMQQMLAGIAHEVRNPLAGMTLFAGILRDELPDGDERRGHVDRIQRELNYLERLVNEFLEYARRQPPELASVELAEIFDEVVQLAAGKDLEVGVERTAIVARADRGQLRRAVLNLARNAVQAASAAGHTGAGAVKLSATETGGEIHIAVWNRGKEIPLANSGKLFEPFYTTREKGTGLGLAFVREIAAAHGGRIDVTSAGGETTFTFVLPA